MDFESELKEKSQERHSHEVRKLAKRMSSWPESWKEVSEKCPGDVPAKAISYSCSSEGLVTDINGVTYDEWKEARRQYLEELPNWEEAPEWAEWAAQDKDGSWMWHEKYPTCCASRHVSLCMSLPAKPGKPSLNWPEMVHRRPMKYWKLESIKHPERPEVTGFDPAKPGADQTVLTVRQHYKIAALQCCLSGHITLPPRESIREHHLAMVDVAAEMADAMLREDERHRELKEE